MLQPDIQTIIHVKLVTIKSLSGSSRYIAAGNFAQNNNNNNCDDIFCEYCNPNWKCATSEHDT